MGLFDRLITLPTEQPPSGLPPAPAIDKYPFVIKELQETEETIVLGGDKMPQDVLPFGGRQRVVRDFYPGNSEPVMHIMGAQENEITINGRLKDKHFTNQGVSIETAKKMDAFRIRGNLLQITWGDWRRFCVIKETKFNLKTTRDIDYSITFDILGFNPPIDCKVLTRKDVPFTISKSLSTANNEFRSSIFEDPLKMDRTILDDLNDFINDAAELIDKAIDYVDNVVGIAEDAVKTVNRAIGVVNNAAAAVHRFQIRIRALGFNDFSKFSIGGSEFERPTRDTYTNIITIRNRNAQAINLMSIMATLIAALAAIAAQLPLARHVVQTGDTLQNLAYKFYGDSSQWQKIKEQNSLTDTTLVPNQILEIPRQ